MIRNQPFNVFLIRFVAVTFLGPGPHDFYFEGEASLTTGSSSLAESNSYTFLRMVLVIPSCLMKFLA